jgi:hypothetical protein
MKTFAQFISENTIDIDGFEAFRKNALEKARKLDRGESLDPRAAPKKLQESKGWMSPKGDAHSVSGQHAYEHHPEIADAVANEMQKKLPKAKRNLGWDEKSQSVGMAQRKGYTRYGRESRLGYSYVHYDKDAPGGKESALHALKHLKPRLGERIHITTHPEYAHGREFTFDSPGKAAHHIRTGGEDLSEDNR